MAPWLSRHRGQPCEMNKQMDNQLAATLTRVDFGDATIWGGRACDSRRLCRHDQHHHHHYNEPQPINPKSPVRPKFNDKLYETSIWGRCYPSVEDEYRCHVSNIHLSDHTLPYFRLYGVSYRIHSFGKHTILVICY